VGHRFHRSSETGDLTKGQSRLHHGPMAVTRTRGQDVGHPRGLGGLARTALSVSRAAHAAAAMVAKSILSGPHTAKPESGLASREPAKEVSLE
jgi:hypothetical protein